MQSNEFQDEEDVTSTKRATLQIVDDTVVSAESKRHARKLLKRVVDNSSYFVLTCKLSTGERLTLIIDRRTGLPTYIALRFLLRERKKGSSARLTILARRLAEFYAWFEAEWHQLLDDALYVSQDANRLGFLEALNDLQLIYDSSTLRNERVYVWSLFIEYVSRPGLWRSGLTISETHQLREVTQQVNSNALADLRSESRPVPSYTHHKPLSPLEEAIVAEVLAGDRLACYFSPLAILRLRAIYSLLRFSGSRIGELLKIRHDDFPLEESAGDKLIRAVIGTSRSMDIVRRPDDPTDSRQNEPSVKRKGRRIEIRNTVTSSVLEYLKHLPKAATDDYLIRTLDGRRALSISTTEKLIKRLGKIAECLFVARHPHHSCSLSALTSHRLRATRAVELVPVFFGDQGWNDIDGPAFLDYFGWSNRESADPYIDSVYPARSRRRLREHEEALRSRNDN